MSANLTCISCKLLFSVPELHLEHYKSDWHCYNLKRRLAELPPLTKDEFEKRAAAFKEANEAKDKKVSLRCESCNKAFSSQNALVDHLKSRKHLLVESTCQKDKSQSNPFKKGDVGKKLTENTVVDMVCDEKEEWVDDDEEEDWESCSDEEVDGVKKVVVDTDDCLFCDYHSNSTEANVAHMTEQHSFFIPDIEYVVDLDGLIAYLAGKIVVGRLCLWCNGKGRGFKSVKAVRDHMSDKGHNKMLYEGEVVLDYADFYDYTEADEVDTCDMSVIEDLLGSNEYELVLPSGATIGHRSLAVYFKQSLKPQCAENQLKIKKVIQQYKALGYTGTSGPAAVKVARDISYVRRIKSRYDLKLGLKANKLQPHFRRQVMF